MNTPFDRGKELLSVWDHKRVWVTPNQSYLYFYHRLPELLDTESPATIQLCTTYINSVLPSIFRLLSIFTFSVNGLYWESYVCYAGIPTVNATEPPTPTAQRTLQWRKPMSDLLALRGLDVCAILPQTHHPKLGRQLTESV